VKVSHIDQVALSSKEKQTTAATSTVSATPKPQITEEEKEEQRLISHSAALATIIQRKKIPALTAYLNEHNLSPDFSLHPISTHSHTSTLLHLASSSNLPSIVSALLSLGANPELTNVSGKTSFEVAGDRATRDRFRLARTTLGESKWNWDSAKITKALTEQEVRERDQRDQSELAHAKALKQAESKRIAEDALKPSMESGHGRGLSARLPESRSNTANDRGLTEEMKVRIERERRARAAEARFAALSRK
jgi:Ankyrin repeat